MTVLLHDIFVRMKAATVSEEWVIHVIFFFALLWGGSLNFSTIELSYINSIASYMAIYLRGDSWKRFYWYFNQDLQKDQLSRLICHRTYNLFKPKWKKTIRNFSSSSIFAYLIRSNMKLVVNFPPALRMFYPGTKNKPIHCIIPPNVLYLSPVCPKHDRFRVNNTGSFVG